MFHWKPMGVITFHCGWFPPLVLPLCEAAGACPTDDILIKFEVQ